MLCFVLVVFLVCVLPMFYVCCALCLSLCVRACVLCCLVFSVACVCVCVLFASRCVSASRLYSDVFFFRFWSPRACLISGFALLSRFAFSVVILTCWCYFGMVLCCVSGCYLLS